MKINEYLICFQVSGLSNFIREEIFTGSTGGQAIKEFRKKYQNNINQEFTILRMNKI